MPRKRSNKMNAHGETGVLCVKYWYTFLHIHRLNLNQGKEREILQLLQFICVVCSLEFSEYISF